MQADDPWDDAQEGAELIAEGELDAAQSVLEALVGRSPENQYAYFYLGCVHYEKDAYAKALAAYVRALELAPDYLGAMVHAGHALRMLGRYQEAIRMAQQVLARSPHDGDAYYLIGASSFARGDDARAVENLEKFLQTNPELEAATEAEGMLQVLRNRQDLN